MRLTLRTLMAWLDDTLPPKDVRRIGRQLERSKFSQDLSRRMRRVVRQRRLTVPGMGSNPPVDPNLVAAYLDNALSAEQTTAYESLCLNSDVHLAEAAACHQILSILDHSPEVPIENLSVLYRLVNGPEARVHADRPLPSAQSSFSLAGKDFPEVAGTDQEWPEPNFARSLPQFVAISGLIAVSMLAGMFVLDRLSGPKVPVAVARPSALAESSGSPSPAEFEQPEIPVDLAPPILPEPPVSAALSGAQSDQPAQPLAAKDGIVKSSDDTAKRDVAADKTEATKSEASAVPDDGVEPVRFEVSDLFSSESDALLLSAVVENGDQGAWTRLTKEMPLTDGQIRFAGSGSIAVKRDTTMWTLASGTLMEAKRGQLRELHSGRIDVRTDAPTVLEWSAGEVGAFRTSSTAGSRYVVSRLNELKSPGAFRSSGDPAIVEIRVVLGQVRVRVGKSDVSLSEGRVARFDVLDGSSPSLVTAASATADVPLEGASQGDALATRTMIRYLSTNRPLPTAVIDAEADDLEAVRNLSMRLALWIERPDIVSDVLTNLDNPSLRVSAIRAVRLSAESGDVAVRKVMDEVAEELVLEESDTVLLESLLLPPSGSSDRGRKRELVNALSHDARLVRQLALEHLMSVSGRDSMGFDPDSPSAKATDAWRVWLDGDDEERKR